MFTVLFSLMIYLSVVIMQGCAADNDIPDGMVLTQQNQGSFDNAMLILVKSFEDEKMKY